MEGKPMDIASMTIGELAGAVGAVVAVVSTVIEISPIKVNPWSAVARCVGRAINKEVLEKVESLEKKVESIEKSQDERAAKDGRVRILRFGDEILHDEKHSKEHFDHILQDITEYEKYCHEHPDFKNDMTVITTARIKATYEQCLKEHSFL
jgi:hypothetical protein